MTEQTKPRFRLSRWFWGGFFIILAFGVLLAVFATVRSAREWALLQLDESRALPQNWTQVIQVTLSGGEAILIDPDAVPRIRRETKAWLEQRQQAAQVPLLATLDEETDFLFVHAQARIPDFADWHFSLTGEYARLFHAITGDLADYLTERLNQLVFEPAGTVAAIDKLTARLDTQLVKQLRRVAGDLRQEMERLIRAERVAPDEVILTVKEQWEFHRQLTEGLQPYIGLAPKDVARQGVATTAGVGLSVVAAKKLAAATVAKASAKIVTGESAGAVAGAVSKLGLKSAAKAGGALGAAGTGAASGAALCAGTIVGMPLAPGCALVGGAVTGLATWLLVDKVVLEADELLHREEFEATLLSALDASREALRASLRTRYTEASRVTYGHLWQDVNTRLKPNPEAAPPIDFVPAEAMDNIPVSRDGSSADTLPEFRNGS